MSFRSTNGSAYRGAVGAGVLRRARRGGIPSIEEELRERGEVADAIACGERAIRLSANDPLLHFHASLLSACLYAENQYERAARMSQLSMQRRPHYPVAWRGLANALVQLGRIDEAKGALAHSLEMARLTTPRGPWPASRRASATRRRSSTTFRPPEATNERFEDANREEAGPAFGQLGSGPSGRYGSDC